ncbi:hypothetical protein [Aquimarina sp. SS2-1]|uniref:hypothetical protein n=1 Tax=Aquimarina besae TaxID=3342247 RepID=UPI00366EE23D
MNKFVFSKTPYFLILQKFSINFLGMEKEIVVRSNLLHHKTEFNIRFDNKKGKLRITGNSFSETAFKGSFDNAILEIKQSSKEINIKYKNIIYDFIFQENLLTGLFVSKKNVGIVKQDKITKFGSEKYYGFIQETIPIEVLLFFLVLFYKIYSKDDFVYYKNKGFTSLNPRIECNPELVLKTKTQFNSK